MDRAGGPDHELLSRLRKRDPELLASLVREHSRPLYRAARALGFSEPDAEDLVQEVFVTFLSSLDRFEGRSQLRTWLFGILHKKAMERRRAQAREGRHDPIDEVFEARFDAQGNWSAPPRDLGRLAEARQLLDAIQHCLERLPPSQRAVFVLREMEGFETKEICKITGVTVTNLGVLIFRARNRLRECLEERGWGKRK